MNFNYKLTSTFLNAISEFYRLHGAIYAMGDSLPWKKQLEQVAGDRAALAAVSLDSQLSVEELIQDRPVVEIPQELRNNFVNYRQTKGRLGEFFAPTQKLDLSTFDQIHQSIQNDYYQPGMKLYRQEERLLPKVVFENGTYQKVSIAIKTRPGLIEEELSQLNEWIADNYRTLNPVLMAACVYFSLAKIHPYADGNGRTAKIVVHGVMYQSGIDIDNILLLEEFYLKNRGQYYDTIGEAIESGDLTKWLEFFANALLYGVTEAVKILQKLSGGSIDLLTNKYTYLSKNQMQVIDALQGSSRSSGAEIGRKLGLSRQYINTLLDELIGQGIVLKEGIGRGSTYSLVTTFKS